MSAHRDSLTYKQTGMAIIDSDSRDDCAIILTEGVDCSKSTNSLLKDTPMDTKKKDKKVKVKSSRKDEESIPSNKDIVDKKLSTLIDEKVQFVEAKTKSAAVPEDEDNDSGGFGIRLFSNSAAPVTILDHQEETPQPKKTTKKINWTPRIREPSPDQKTKIRDSVVDASHILDQVEVKSWHKNEERLIKKVDLYNLRNGNLFPVDPTNEFTKLRKKNNWDFKKISQGIKRKAE